MPFRFLLYLQPVRYFSIPRRNGTYIYPKVSSLPEGLLQKFVPNSSYTSKTAMEYDTVWQAIHCGYMGGDSFYTRFDKLPLQDEYVFVRSYFSAVWSWYVLIIRLFSFKNPIAEFNAFSYAKNVQKQQLSSEVLPYNDFSTFSSDLVVSKPFVSVIIPTLNRYEYLKDVLEDLEKQTYQNFEVIVVDQSDEFSEFFYKKFQLDLQFKRQEEKALWLARNTAIEMSNGEYLLFFDDDSRVGTDWITNHLACLDYFNADASSGVSLNTGDGKIPQHYSFYRIADQLDTGNVLLKKEVFRNIGMFDRQFEKQRMGDGEFGMRMLCKWL